MIVFECSMPQNVEFCICREHQAPDFEIDPVQKVYGPVTSVNGQIGDVVLTADDLNTYTKEESDLKIRSGAGAPTSSTVGVLGTIYNDTETGNKYVCISVGEGQYGWERKRIPELGAIEEGNTGYVNGGQVYDYNKDNIVFRRF